MKISLFELVNNVIEHNFEKEKTDESVRLDVFALVIHAKYAGLLLNLLLVLLLPVRLFH